MIPKQFLLCALAAAMPLLADAQEARSSKWVNMRAGPARDYPLVAAFGPGTPLAVQGCTDGFGWCDVIGPNGARGWIFAGNIVYPYQSADVPVIGYGALIGLPIVTFAIGSYWGNYYRGRPWYGNMPNWAHHRPPPRPPAFRPPPRPGIRPPPGGDQRPPTGARPPGNNRPPPTVRPPGGNRPAPNVRPPGGNGPPANARPGAGRPTGAPGGRPQGGGRPEGGEQRDERR
jgi:uncharacterized protein YraI